VHGGRAGKPTGQALVNLLTLSFFSLFTFASGSRLMRLSSTPK